MTETVERRRFGRRRSFLLARFTAVNVSARTSYALVLGVALLCYAALGAMLRLLPDYVQDQLHAGPLALGIAVGAPAITAVVARPAGGRQADRRGPMPVVVFGALVMTAATVPLLATGSLPALLASRLGVGIGEGLMMSAAVLWLLRLAGPGRRGRALGHIGLANYGGLTLGPLVADALGGDSHPERIFAAAALLPALGALVVLALPRPAGDGAEQASLREVLRVTARPGAGLMLVNFGYVALISFAPGVVAAHGAGVAQLVVPVFAGTVIVARTAAAGVPDRFGARRTLTASAFGAAAGLVAIAAFHAGAGVLLGVLVVGAGQALAVPALGLLALARVAPESHGAAAGAFFAWFDAGVGLGGLTAGAVAHVTSPPGSLLAAAAAVALVPPVAGRAGAAPSPGAAPRAGARAAARGLRGRQRRASPR